MTDDELWHWLTRDPARDARDLVGLPLGELDSSLLDWTLARRWPVLNSIDADLRLLVAASRTLKSVPFRYNGGSQPGSTRQIHPSSIYEVAGFPGIFVTGWCRRVRSLRTFRFDRMRLETG